MTKVIKAFDKYHRPVDYAVHDGDYTVEVDEEADATRQFAFWGYDIFPYVLHGEIDKTAGKEGYYYTKNFGGYTFKADVVLPAPVAEKAIKELKEITDQRSIAIKAVESTYRSILRSWGKHYNVPLPKHVTGK